MILKNQTEDEVLNSLEKNNSRAAFRTFETLYDVYLNPKLRTDQCTLNSEMTEAYNSEKMQTLGSIVKMTELFSTNTDYLADEAAKMVYQQMQQYPLPASISDEPLSWVETVFGKIIDIRGILSTTRELTF